MRFIISFLLFGLMLSMAGCVSFSNLSKSETLPEGSSEAVFVLGVTPRFRVAVAPGEVVDEKVKTGSMAAVNAYPEGGYIVGKVSAAAFPNQYHIQLILPDGISAFAEAYGPCGNDRVLSFHAPAGSVIYVGSVEYLRLDGKLAIRYSEDFEGARQYMMREYPSLAGRLKTSGLQTRLIQYVDCGRKVTIPVFVPAHR